MTAHSLAPLLSGALVGYVLGLVLIAAWVGTVEAVDAWRRRRAASRYTPGDGRNYVQTFS